MHVADSAQVKEWAREVPDAAERLAQRYWPGPLTLILKRAAHVSDLVTGGQDTVALRVPSHPIARALLLEFGSGVAAPSANRYGRVSATTAQHVRNEFGDAVECVLDGGASDVGIESTIVDLSGMQPALLRPGSITLQQLEETLGQPLAPASATSPRAPGTLAKHYAPQTPLMLMEADLVLELAASMTRQGHKVAVLARSVLQPLIPGATWMTAARGPAGYAHRAFTQLAGARPGRLQRNPRQSSHRSSPPGQPFGTASCAPPQDRRSRCHMKRKGGNGGNLGFLPFVRAERSGT